MTSISIIGYKNVRGPTQRASPAPCPIPFMGEFWFHLPPKVRLFSFSSSYNRRNSGIWFWLFSGELLKRCFRVGNPSFGHNLEIKGYVQMKNALQHLFRAFCTDGKDKRKEWKEKEGKWGKEKRRGKENILHHKLCSALWMSFNFILTSFPWKEILLSPFCRWRNWGLVILIHPRSYSEDAVWQVQRYKYTS